MFQTFIAWLLGLGQSLLLALEGAGSYLLKNGGAVLVESASDAVAAAEAAGGSGEDKFNAAKAAVIADLQVKGVPVVEGAIETAIQIAYSNLQTQQSAEAAATAATAAGTPAPEAEAEKTA